jgi:hypothetical protein
MPHNRFDIGGIVVALNLSKDQGNPFIEESYLPFLTTKPPEVILDHHFGPMPDFSSWENVFDSQSVWRLYQRGKEMGIAFHSEVYGAQPYRAAVFQQDFKRGEIYTSGEYFSDHSYPFPLQYPMAEVMMIHLLAQGRGLLLHACAVKDGTNGLLFAGVSGAGKSTMASLWSEQLRATILSDDRVILQKKGEKIWIFGTPWHGDARAVSPLGVPLKHIFILTHAGQNQVAPLTPSELAVRLFVRSFPTYWDQAGINYSLELLDQTCQQVLGGELGFTPDSGIINFVREYVAEHA